MSDKYWEDYWVWIGVVLMFGGLLVGLYPISGIGFLIFMACVGAGIGRHEM